MAATVRHDPTMQYKMQNSDKLVSRVTHLLGSRQNRQQGLLTLKEVLKQCRPEIFQEHAVSWSGLLLKTLQSYDSGATLAMSYDVSSQLIQQLGPFPEQKREFSKIILPQLLDAIIQQPRTTLSSLRCLKSCFIGVPKACGPFKNKLEGFLLKTLATAKGTELEAAAGCFGKLPGLGGAGNHGEKHREAWLQQQARLLSTLSSVFGKMYAGLIDEPLYNSTGGYPVELKSTSNWTYESEVSQHARHFARWTKVVCTFMRQSSEISFPVEITAYLKFLQNIFTLEPVTLLKRPTFERVILASGLVDVYLCNLALLDTLIRSCKQVLLPYSSVINNMFVQLLRQTQNDKLDDQVSSKMWKLKVAVYNSISCWVLAVGPSSGISSVCGIILPIIITECILLTSESPETIMNTKLAVPMTKKSKKKGKFSGYEGSGVFKSQQVAMSDSQKKVCVAAFKVLYQILMQCGVLMSVSSLQLVSDWCDSQLKNTDKLLLAQPYNQQTECRKMFYDVLLSAAAIPNLLSVGQVRSLLTTLTNGLADPSPSVVQVCRTGLQSLQSVIHPRVPSLCRPAVVQNNKNVSPHNMLQNFTVTSDSNVDAVITPNLPNITVYVTDSEENNRSASSQDVYQTNADAIMPNLSNISVPEVSREIIMAEDLREKSMKEQEPNAEQNISSTAISNDSPKAIQQTTSPDEECRKTPIVSLPDVTEKKVAPKATNLAEDCRKTTTVLLPSVGEKRAADAPYTTGSPPSKRLLRKVSSSEDDSDAMELLADFVDADPDES